MSKENDYLKMVTGSPQSQPALPPLVCQIRDDALAILDNSLEELFAHCDDLFFDLSSRAASNAEQNLYFESMRELRVKKSAVLSTFRQHMEQSFAALPRSDSKAPPPPAQSDGLALVQADELEQEVALSDMTRRARATNQEALYQLSMRLDYLLPQVRITPDNNPLDPAALCRNFARACERLDITIKARIIIFKQFERLVIARFINVYTSANELLIHAGILPRISHRIGKSAHAEPLPATAAEPEIDSTTAETLQFDFSELSNLLAGMRRLGPQYMPSYRVFSDHPGPLMTNAELIGLLSALQWKSPFDPADSTLSTAPDLRQLVYGILLKANANQPQSLQQPDEDVINLVAMFFDFVLDDNNLPVGIQALISRLQIPILKVALRDHTFFSHSDHPARKLINSIAEASIGWDEADQPRRDKLYNAICEIVQTVNENYREEPGIFAEQLAHLERLIEDERQRTALVEKRTSQAAEGHARTLQARQVVQTLLFGKLEAVQLPVLIADLLTQQWQQLLILVHLRHGEESAEWLQAIQLIDDLLWTMRPHTDARSHQRLAKITPDLLQRISHGLHQLATPQGVHDQLMRDVSALLTRLRQGESVALKPINATQAMALGHTPGSGSRSWQEMTALERQQARYKALTYEFIRQAETIPLGTWISYEDSRRGKIVRCKLAARIKVSDSYIFVNRFGFKVLEKLRKDFAYDIQQGRATPLETGPLFERAMASIVDSLRGAGRAQPMPG